MMDFRRDSMSPLPAHSHSRFRYPSLFFLHGGEKSLHLAAVARVEAQVLVALGKIERAIEFDASQAPRQHDGTTREKYRLGDGVRDEDHGHPARGPQLAQTQ